MDWILDTKHGATSSADLDKTELCSLLSRPGLAVRLRCLAVLLRQSDGDCLNLGVRLQSVLAQLPAHPGLLVAAEWDLSLQHVIAVDPDRSGTQRVGHVERLADILEDDTYIFMIGPDR